MRERERANAKLEMSGSEGSFFLSRWMYNKWKGKIIPQESSEARKDCEAERERLYSSLRKGIEPKKKKKTSRAYLCL